jgi:hypothetical protein
MAEGGDVPVVYLKNIVPHLSCLVCNEPLLTVTRLCERGHTFCINCRPYLNYCTECLGKFLAETRNYSIGNIANMVKYKCNNYDAGCRTLLTRDLILKHNATCSMSPVICPLANIPRAKCAWTGFLHQVLGHVTTYHKDKITNGNYFKCTSLQDAYWLTIYKGEIFICYKHVKDGILYAAVMKVGLKADMFRGIFILKSPDPKSGEAIEMGFGVELVDNMEEVFNSGRCLMLDDVVVKRFAINREMNMAVSIEERKTV